MRSAIFRMLLLLAIAVNAPPVHGQTYTVGDTVCFTVAAIDSQGDTIRDWDLIGSPCSILLEGSTANTDTSAQSWSAQSDGFTYATILNNGAPLLSQPPNEWALPETLFTNGTVNLCLVHTASGRHIKIKTCQNTSKLRVSPAIEYEFDPGPLDHFFIELTPARPPDKVYLKRIYEILVVPRDTYLNHLDTAVNAQVTARYPAEFEQKNGILDISQSPITITGPTNYYLSSTVARNQTAGQWVRFFNTASNSSGQTLNYEILDHPPAPFKLIAPPDGHYVTLTSPLAVLSFTWEESTDAYKNIAISRDATVYGNDVIEYTLHVLDSATLVKQVSVLSDGNGLDPRYSTTFAGIGEIAGRIFGSAPVMPILWYAEATDGLYTTNCSIEDASRPLPGHYLRLYADPGTNSISPLPQPPSGITLHQNYPNPVAAGSVTNIRFETMVYGHVSLKVYDMLGSEVATLADESLAPGVYNADWYAAGLAPGVYHYSLTADGNSVTKSLVITQ